LNFFLRKPAKSLTDAFDTGGAGRFLVEDFLFLVADVDFAEAGVALFVPLFGEAFFFSEGLAELGVSL